MFILIDFDRTWPENPGLSNPEEELHNAFVPIFDAWELFWWGFCRGTATGRPSTSRPSFWWVMYQSHPISSLQAPPQWKKFSSGTVWLVASFFFPVSQYGCGASTCYSRFRYDIAIYPPGPPMRGRQSTAGPTLWRRPQDSSVGVSNHRSGVPKNTATATMLLFEDRDSLGFIEYHWHLCIMTWYLWYIFDIINGIIIY